MIHPRKLPKLPMKVYIRDDQIMKKVRLASKTRSKSRPSKQSKSKRKGGAPHLTIDVHTPIIDDYYAADLLGTGAFGSVYRTNKRSDSGKYVVKIMDTAELDRQYIINEINVMNALRSPHTLRYVDHYPKPITGSGYAYIISEYLGGYDPLSKFVVDTPVTPENYSIYATGISNMCEGLAYMHERGVLHRDIKPDNIMINADGHIKYIDFGISYLHGVVPDEFLGRVCGTPDFIDTKLFEVSPDKITMDRWQRADIYSLGITLYSTLSEDYHTPCKDCSEFCTKSSIRPFNETVLPKLIDGSKKCAPFTVVTELNKTLKELNKTSARGDWFGWIPDMITKGTLLYKGRSTVPQMSASAPASRAEQNVAKPTLDKDKIIELIMGQFDDIKTEEDCEFSLPMSPEDVLISPIILQMIKGDPRFSDISALQKDVYKMTIDKYREICAGHLRSDEV
jgi:serine/threonine protein kinase